MERTLVFDTETSGLPDFKKPADDPSQPRVCSIAAMLIDEDFAPLGKMHALVRPDGWVVPAETAAIHGLTTEILLERGRPIAEVVGEFLGLWDQAATVAAYGIAFDLKMLRGELRRLGRPDHYGEKPQRCVMIEATKICKMPPTDKMLGAGFKNYKAPRLHEAVEIILGKKMDGAHDAMADVSATVRLMLHMDGLKAGV